MFIHYRRAGNSSNLLKVGTKRRRTAVEIEDAKNEEIIRK